MNSTVKKKPANSRRGNQLLIYPPAALLKEMRREAKKLPGNRTANQIMVEIAQCFWRPWLEAERQKHAGINMQSAVQEDVAS
jgi:hypothetical protein